LATQRCCKSFPAHPMIAVVTTSLLLSAVPPNVYSLELDQTGKNYTATGNLNILKWLVGTEVGTKTSVRALAGKSLYDKTVFQGKFKDYEIDLVIGRLQDLKSYQHSVELANGHTDDRFEVPLEFGGVDLGFLVNFKKDEKKYSLTGHATFDLSLKVGLKLETDNFKCINDIGDATVEAQIAEFKATVTSAYSKCPMLGDWVLWFEDNTENIVAHMKAAIEDYLPKDLDTDLKALRAISPCDMR